MKTKAQEIEILKQAIADLGPDSYLGPWLTDLVAELTRDLRNDFLPIYTLAQTKADCKAERDTNMQLIADWKATAQKQADELQRQTLTRCSDIRLRCLADLQKAIKDLE